MWFYISLSLVALLAVVSVVYLWLRNRRLKRSAEDWARIARLGHETNYRLSCQVFGREVVDRVIRQAHERGGN